jgi:hypothetical protein
MASYRGHLLFASALGAGYGALAAWHLHYYWGAALLGAGLTTLGGLLPDLDSDSGVPVRELFGITAAAVPLLAFHRLRHLDLSPEQLLVILGGIYLLIRFGISYVFKRFTVHRGMFHSVPAMLISGLATYLAFQGREPYLRLYLAGAVMLGFLSHLVLDELYSVDFNGTRIKLNRFAGSALKFFSPSVVGTLVCYVVLGGLGYLAWLDWTEQARGAQKESPPMAMGGLEEARPPLNGTARPPARPR